MNVQQLSNPCLRQFLNMSLVYRVDPGRLGEKVLSSKSSKKNNIFNGSSGRIVVDEVDDEDVTKWAWNRLMKKDNSKIQSAAC